MYISFIIPAYNAEKFLEKCVYSIIDQEIGENDFEIILVNDGSKDQTENICIQLQEQHPFISYYSKQNGGPGDTRNLGLTKAKGDYIWFVDADDYLESNVLPQLLTHLKEQIDIYFIGYKRADFQGEIEYVVSYKTENITTIESLDRGHYLNTVWSKLIKKDLFDKLHLSFNPDLKMAEDFELSFKLMIGVSTIKTIDLLCYNYIKTPHSLISNRSEAHMQKIAEDSITVGRELRKRVKAIKNIKKHGSFDAWLSSYLFGLLLSFFNFKYSSAYVASSLKTLAADDNYPIPSYAKNWKRNLFLKVANVKPLFLLLIAVKRIVGK
jgi:glycosyltransferase involved in cell wall biosynthesis